MRAWIVTLIIAAGTVPAEVLEAPRVTVCLAASGAAGDFLVARAQGIAGKMFAGVGIGIDWREYRGCPADGLLITFSQNTPDKQLPGALAYALPYEGTHIVVFYDRIRTRAAGPVRAPAVLAHVLVHEITHILQGVTEHSASGVMKASWDENDYQQMAYKPLAFTPKDLEMIRTGLEFRQRREIAAR